MTYKKNIKAILECYFTGFKEEIIDGACNRILQEPNRDMKEIEEVINCDADAETKCKMIANIVTAKPHYFEELQERRNNE